VVLELPYITTKEAMKSEQVRVIILKNIMEYFRCVNIKNNTRAHS
jgi:hypothetical protein